MSPWLNETEILPENRTRLIHASPKIRNRNQVYNMLFSESFILSLLNRLLVKEAASFHCNGYLSKSLGVPAQAIFKSA